MSNQLSDKIEDIVRTIIDSKGGFLVEVVIRGENYGKIVEVFVDTDKGITTELCAEISRELSAVLDVADIIRGRYHLVVSSPGIDRPLKFPRQYLHHVGRMLIIKCNTKEQSQRIEGELIYVLIDGIELRMKDSSVVKCPFEDIIEAHVKLPW